MRSLVFAVLVLGSFGFHSANAGPVGYSPRVPDECEGAFLDPRVFPREPQTVFSRLQVGDVIQGNADLGKQWGRLQGDLHLVTYRADGPGGMTIGFRPIAKKRLRDIDAQAPIPLMPDGFPGATVPMNRDQADQLNIRLIGSSILSYQQVVVPPPPPLMTDIWVHSVGTVIRMDEHLYLVTGISEHPEYRTGAGSDWVSRETRVTLVGLDSRSGQIRSRGFKTVILGGAYSSRIQWPESIGELSYGSEYAFRVASYSPSMDPMPKEASSMAKLQTGDVIRAGLNHYVVLESGAGIYTEQGVLPQPTWRVTMAELTSTGIRPGDTLGLGKVITVLQTGHYLYTVDIKARVSLLARVGLEPVITQAPTWLTHAMKENQIHSADPATETIGYIRDFVFVR